MKRILIALLALFAVSCSAPRAAQAQIVDIDFDFDLYPDYYTDYNDDIYRYGFNINNYAYQYEDRFVAQVSREYGISRSVVRRYLRQGFSPSDILFGAELAYRTGNRFQYIMNGYYNSASHNWINISLNLGIPYGSPRFNLILGSFNRYYRDWGTYYYHRHPRHAPPPMYRNSWSYFRPSSTSHRPSDSYRPNSRPSSGPGRPVGGVSRPQSSGSSVSRPNSSGSSAPASRPQAQPQSRPQGNSSGTARPSAQPERNTRPAPQSNDSGVRRGSSGSNSSGRSSSSRSGSGSSSSSSRSSSGSRR